MKRIRPLIGLVTCSIALAIASTAAAQTAQDGIAKVVNIKGSARYMTGSNTAWQPLKNGAILKAGTIVQTASGSYVDLVFNNPSAMSSPVVAVPVASGGAGSKPNAVQDATRMFENTVLALDKLAVTDTGADTITETELDLKAGRIFGTVRKLSTTSQFKVKIPNGVAGIRGTIYDISADGVLSVVTGSVVLAYVGKDGSVVTQVVTGGQQFDTRTGQLTQIPDTLYQELLMLANLYQTGRAVRPAIITMDQTVYYVSPTMGMSSGGGGGGGGGEEF